MPKLVEPVERLVLFYAHTDSAGNTPPECFFVRTIRWPTREDRECQHKQKNQSKDWFFFYISGLLKYSQWTFELASIGIGSILKFWEGII